MRRGVLAVDDARMNTVGKVGYRPLELKVDQGLVAGWSGGGCGGDSTTADAFLMGLETCEESRRFKSGRELK